MNETQWLSSVDPAAMRRHLIANAPAVNSPADLPLHGPLNRRLRLFAVACCRRVWDGTVCQQCGGSRWVESNVRGIYEYCPTCHGTGTVGGLPDPRSRRAVDVAERYADGQATTEELDYCFTGALAAHPSAVVDTNPLAVMVTRTAISTHTNWVNAEHVQISQRAGVPPPTQAALLRCVFGNPFRPVPVLRVRVGGNMGLPEPRPHPWLAWNDGCVLKMAQAIYDERAWDRLPVLCDALEEAGCTDAAILAHGRGPGPHARGCFVIDTILGRE